MTQGNMDTMLTKNILNSRDIIENLLHGVDACNQLETKDYFDVSNKILTFAPGEGKMLIYENPLSGYLAFPTVFCGQMRPSNKECIRIVHPNDLYKAEVKHVDNRVWSHVTYIFWRAKAKLV